MFNKKMVKKSTALAITGALTMAMTATTMAAPGGFGSFNQNAGPGGFGSLTKMQDPVETETLAEQICRLGELLRRCRTSSRVPI